MISDISHPSSVPPRPSDFGLRTSGFGHRTSAFDLRTSNFDLRTPLVGFRFSDFLRISDLGFRISTFGFRISVFGSLFLLVFVVGCKVGPDYHRPSPVGTNAMPANFSSATNAVAWKLARPSAHLPRGSWWEVFGDAELNRLEQASATNNQELVAAVARLAQARASVGVSRANLFPQIDATPSYTRQRSSYNQPQSGHAAGINPTYNTFTAALQVGWEPDLWGRVRRQVESARAQLAASADDLESLRLVLQAELAADYFALRDIQEEYLVLERTSETYKRSLELTQNRRQGGVVSDLDVDQAETQLRTIEAQLPELRLRQAQLLHAIATLCGRPATGFALARAAASGPLPAIPLELPAELLERRPDVAAAEQRMAGANARVGVSKAAFYPSVRINGLAGFQSIDASTWFDWPSRMWSVGPSLDLPLFTGGRNKAQLALSRAAYDETVANYRQTVLSAFQEVEDQLAAQQLVAEQLNAEIAAMAAAQRLLDVANNRYKSGLTTYLDVVTAQTTELTHERAVVQLRGQQLSAAVGLVKALGGGWAANASGTPKSGS
jgi:outer membrane protein, multidrug efflux system